MSDKRTTANGDNASAGQPADRTDKCLDEFQIAEYQNIANAHFSMVTSISHFFQYYLIIAALPVSAAAVLFRLAPASASGDLMPDSYRPAITGVFTVIALVGFLVMIYVVNLRLDALLYARTVNGVRGYFWDKFDVSPEVERVLRALPRKIDTPGYWETRYFLPVVMAFGLVDSGYLLLGWFLFPNIRGSMWLVLVGACAALFLALHVLVYHSLCRFREKKYLR